MFVVLTSPGIERVERLFTSQCLDLPRIKKEAFFKPNWTDVLMRWSGGEWGLILARKVWYHQI